MGPGRPRAARPLFDQLRTPDHRGNPGWQAARRGCGCRRSGNWPGQLEHGGQHGRTRLPRAGSRGTARNPGEIRHFRRARGSGRCGDGDGGAHLRRGGQGARRQPRRTPCSTWRRRSASRTRAGSTRAARDRTAEFAAAAHITALSSVPRPRGSGTSRTVRTPGTTSTSLRSLGRRHGERHRRNPVAQRCPHARGAPGRRTTTAAGRTSSGRRGTVARIP